ncbi:MAG: sigma-70 family RNA polymerase sigma factor [Lachnospiraceae bacterium]|jgi:RNA polymerase sigma-70 factor (ECF subfamily)|nr:sigma-70 family RNA polymerase sigma factor [Lachnospiraceae bacterium]
MPIIYGEYFDMSDYTDGQLYIRYLKDNDEDSFRILFEKYKDSLFLFLNRIVFNEDDAEELMMDTFAILSSGTAKYKERDNISFKTWLYAIAKNQAKMFLRKNKTSFIELDENNLSENGQVLSPESNLLTNERNSELYVALNHLDYDTRQVLYLIYFENMSAEEISKIMKMNIKKIYNITSRGKAALKDKLERMGYTWNI